MPVYSYTAMDMNGKQLKGELSSDSKQNAISYLKMQKLFPLNLEEKKQNKKATGMFFSMGSISKKHIAVFTRQFASLLHAGVPLSSIFDVLIKQEGNRSFKSILEAVNADILKGNTLSDAMSKFKVFPPILTSMAAVGEVNGRLDVSFDRVAITMEKDMKLASKIKGAMIYPLILLVVTILASLLLTFLVLPTFVRMFEQMGAELPATTLIFINLSKFMTGYWYIAAAVVLVSAIITVKLMHEPAIKKKIDYTVLKFPLIGPLKVTIAMARFCRTFSALVDAGVGVLPSLDTVRNVIDNTYIKSSFDEIMRDVQMGSTIFQSVSKYGIFPSLVVSMIRIGEESGKLGDVLAKTAEFYEDEAEARLQKATSMLEPMITVFMALGVGFVVISIIQPMFQIYDIIGK